MALYCGPAAGIIKLPHELEQAVRWAVSHVAVGSTTPNERVGNIGETYYHHPVEKWSLNSIGLKNRGYKNYLAWIAMMARICHAHGKKLVVSIAGDKPEDYGEMARAFLEAGADEVEFNLGCPNVWGKAGQKPIPSYDPAVTEHILRSAKGILPIDSKVAVKISPVEDLGLLRELFHTIKNSGIVFRIVGVNTIPNISKLREDGSEALAFRISDDDKEMKHKGGLAGGKEIKKAGLRTLEEGRKIIPDSMEYVGVGGIRTGADALDYLMAGATGFASATGVQEEAGGYFESRWQELADLPGAHRYLSDTLGAISA